MIVLTRLDGKELVVNADHVLTVEATPDTVIQLVNAMHLMVKEPPDEVVERVAAWRRRCQLGPERRGDVLPFPRSVPNPED
ncbi:MAG: flagellar FlbD family protein [Anaeromyxobacter sp.]|nr:flagellar FlbD family protein [Anaeromyxobacter sp.]MBL0276197.1 flagellar FlbD family protein [Anaeromyxobacter sp.]